MLNAPAYSDTKDGVTFNYYANERNFSSARLACKSQGSHLAYIKNEKHYSRIKKYLHSQDEQYWWVGLHKEKNKWKWLDGSDLNESILGFRDDSGTTKCAALFKSNVRLYDYRCEEQSRMCYICQSRNQDDVSSSTEITKIPAETPQGPIETPQTIGPGTVAAIALSILLCIAFVILLVLWYSKRGRNHGAATKNNIVQSNPEILEHNNQSVAYAVIDEYPKQDITDAVIYTEIGENQLLGCGEDAAAASSNTTDGVNYAVINTSSKVLHTAFDREPTDYAEIPTPVTTGFDGTAIYAEARNNYSIAAGQESAVQYAQVMKKKTYE